MFIILIYLAFISLGIPDSLLGVTWPMIYPSLGTPLSSAGYITMTVSLGTVVSSLNASRLVKKFGTGKVTLVSVAMTAFALLGFSWATSLVWLLIFAIPLGLGAGAIDTGLNEFVAEHFEARHMSWLHASWGIGAMLGPVLISIMVSNGLTWRNGYMGISAIQTMLVILLLFSLPYWKKYNTFQAPDETAAPSRQTSKIRTLFKLKGIGYALSSFFLYISIENSFNVWGATYLVQVHSIHPEQAAAWISIYFFGIITGRIATGILTAKIHSNYLIRAGIILIICGILLITLAGHQYITLLGFILIGCGLAPIFPSLLHLTPEHFGKKYSQDVMGLQMAASYVAATVVPLMLGNILQKTTFTFFPFIAAIFSLVMFFTTYRLSQIRN